MMNKDIQYYVATAGIVTMTLLRCYGIKVSLDIYKEWYPEREDMLYASYTLARLYTQEPSR
jgi:hypothetical protein